jgi:methylamine dehydrogenase accessory protein MauD
MDFAISLTVAAVAVVVVFHSLVLLGLVQVVHELHRELRGSREPGTDGGQIAPEFEAVDVTGRPVGSQSLRGRLTALLFVSPTCPGCTTTLAETRALRHKANDSVVVICRESVEACRSLALDYGTQVPVVADADGEISRRYGISAVPSAVLIGSDGRVRSVGSPVREDLESLASASGVAQV